MSHDDLWARYQRSMQASESLREANRVLAGGEDELDFSFRMDSLQQHRTFGDASEAVDDENDLLFAGQSAFIEHGDAEARDRVNLFTNINDLLEHNGHHFADIDESSGRTATAAAANEKAEEMHVEQPAQQQEEGDFLVNSPRIFKAREEPAIPSEHCVQLMLAVVKRHGERLREREQALARRQQRLDTDTARVRSQVDPVIAASQMLFRARAALRQQDLTTGMEPLSDEQLGRLMRHLDCAPMVTMACLCPERYALRHAVCGPYLLLSLSAEHYVIVHNDHLSH